MRRPVFVQFLHPGKEHKPNGKEFSWNTGEHKRKFLINPGIYLSKDISEPLQDDIIFWGEWEPESTVVKKLVKNKGDLPKYIHQPYYRDRQDYRGLQNTDPFVFGENFIYSNCRQGKIHKLRNLPEGSLILYGSSKGDQFVLDTVFVVSNKWIDINSSNIATVLPRLSKTFIDACVAPLYPAFFAKQLVKDPILPTSCTTLKANDTSSPKVCGMDGECTFRIYFGVNYEQRHEYGGMFSFFPCKPYTDTSCSFSRPLIKLDKDILTPNLKMGAKLSPRKSMEELKTIWDQVVYQVTSHADLKLGVYTDLPKIRA